jgi:tetratricopeptide (TPR) repeat protein
LAKKILIFLILTIAISISFSQSFKQQELNRDILIKASYFYNTQRYELARDLLAQALKGISYPEDLYRIRYMYAKTLFKLYNFSDGINSLENILFISPDKYSASFLLKRLDFLKNFKRSDPPKSLVFVNSINGFDYKNNVE